MCALKSLEKARWRLAKLPMIRLNLTWVHIANEQFHHNDNVLFISYDPEKHKFEFEHRTLSDKNDKKICDEKDAFQTLSLFLKYKFGVLFDPKVKTKSGSSI